MQGTRNGADIMGNSNIKKRNYIFGAKATAAGLYRALSALEPRFRLDAFLVSSAAENVTEIWGHPVMELREVAAVLSPADKAEACVYVAVPELIHGEIRSFLEQSGFANLIMLDSRKEAEIMEKYYVSEGRFRSVHDLTAKGNAACPKLTIYSASFYRDQSMTNPPKRPLYIKSLFLGCDRATDAGVDISGRADYCDNTGDHISGKNPIRCEMTAHYWIWKNRLQTDDEYVGVCHYRRFFDLTEEDLKKIKENDVDVVLPYPMLHYPNARVHHTWYVPERDWELMVRVVGELYPDYAQQIDAVFDAPEFYNYNMILAKKSVFADYCAWLYPILDRIEELSEPRGADRQDRYTAYLSESLETLYFMANLKNLKICHTGRLLYS